MVLSRPDLLERIRSGGLGIEPPVDASRVGQVSIDLKLGRRFSRFRSVRPGHIAAIHVDPALWSSQDLWEHFEDREVYRLEPGAFVLAHTLERVRIPNDLVGLVEGRSSFARVGVTVHVTAPKIDPGFQGTITLEMANFGTVPVDLRPGVDEPAQLLLLRLTSPLADADLYGAGAEDVFQYQADPLTRSPRVSGGSGREVSG